MATTVVFDGTVDDATVARVTRLETVTSGDESYTQPLTLGRSAVRSERFIYRPLPTSRAISLQVFALDDTGTVLAAGHSAVLSLAEGKTTTANITLDAMDVPDAGLDFAGPDLADDAAAPADLAPSGPSRCDQLIPGDNAFICAGFESTSDTLNANSHFGSTTIDATRAYRGKSSMRLSVDPGSAGMRKSAEQNFGPLTDTGMYATRAFYFMQAPPPSATHMLDFEQQVSPYHEIVLNLDTSGKLRSSLTTVSATVNKVSATSFPFGRWVCIEMRVTWGDATSGQVRYFMDDQEIGDLAYDGTTMEAPRLTIAVYGQYYGVGPAAGFDLWIDEAMIASSPIGCAK